MAPKKKAKCLSKTLDIYKVIEVYGDLFYALRAIISKHNPIDFGHLEDQPDEYDPEVATIIVQLRQQMSKDEIYNLVVQEFNRWFEPIPISKVACLELSIDIFAWYTEITLPEEKLESLIKVKR